MQGRQGAAGAVAPLSWFTASQQLCCGVRAKQGFFAPGWKKKNKKQKNTSMKLQGHLQTLSWWGRAAGGHFKSFIPPWHRTAPASKPQIFPPSPPWPRGRILGPQQLGTRPGQPCPVCWLPSEALGDLQTPKTCSRGRGRADGDACLQAAPCEHRVRLHVSSLGEESGFRGCDGFEQRGWAEKGAVGLMAGGNGAAGRGRRDGALNTSLWGLLATHPGLAPCCAPP